MKNILFFKIFCLASVVHISLEYFWLCPLVVMSHLNFGQFTKSTFSMLLNILNTWMRSPRFLLASRIFSPIPFNLSLYGSLLKPGIYLVTICWIFTFWLISPLKYWHQTGIANSITGLTYTVNNVLANFLSKHTYVNYW